ncbi:hypothetical protein GT347_05875 [Xylophilus rhododendri]|uniref:Uncharacterized protein n=1 Tax=Xylophilus rhododendri TaxID=2697032 RepID=A0A857J3V5_9BURK|nr:hypothetical protein [Xylophilus rhododendri]QHI97558.1 hypothetical protein GT347_05875 [Xylophilus rhododendri]
MSALIATATSSHLAAIATVALDGAARVLDQSMRRPSLAGWVLHSIHLI